MEMELFQIPRAGWYPKQGSQEGNSPEARRLQESVREMSTRRGFPQRWKLQRLVPLPKRDKPPSNPSGGYHPICLLDTMVKIFERIIYKRLIQVVEARGALLDFQLDFRKARSTMDAIQRTTATNIAEKAIEGKRCRGVIIDSISSLGLPAYLHKIICSYFRDRRLLYNTGNIIKYHNVSARVPEAPSSAHCCGS